MKNRNIVKLKKPSTQTSEVLYMLIREQYLSRADFFNKLYCLNAPAQIHNLRKYGINIHNNAIQTVNRFGRTARYVVYELKGKDVEKAIEVYHILNK